MVSVSLKLTEALEMKLSAAARKRRQTKSALVREALERFLEEDRVASQGSCFDLASDLVGCVGGPGDLSASESHLLGYGQ